MATITGIWERLPEHGEKPVDVKRCEEHEAEIRDLELKLRTARTLHATALKMAMAHIADNWTRSEIGQAIFPDSLDLADHMPNAHNHDSSEAR